MKDFKSLRRRAEPKDDEPPRAASNPRTSRPIPTFSDGIKTLVASQVRNPSTNTIPFLDQPVLEAVITQTGAEKPPINADPLQTEGNTDSYRPLIEDPAVQETLANPQRKFAFLQQLDTIATSNNIKIYMSQLLLTPIKKLKLLQLIVYSPNFRE